MDSRFNYRAYVHGLYETKDGEKKNINFMVYNIIPQTNGTSACSIDDVIDTICDIDELTEEDIESLLSNFEYGNEDWYICETEKSQQCTGIVDKNMKLIYEGDIVSVKTSDMEKPTIAVVEWLVDDAAFSLVSDYEHELPFYGSLIEIVGNIHENPDLVKPIESSIIK